jgi:hypothetical protein
MKLYHGTNTLKWQEIQQTGYLRGPVYLSNDVRVARYFADWHGWRTRADSVILTLNVDEQQFAVDEMSLLDPIPLAQKTMGIRDMAAYLSELAKHGESVWIAALAKSHGIEYQHEWEVSLQLAHAVKHMEPIGLEHVAEVVAAREHYRPSMKKGPQGPFMV